MVHKEECIVPQIGSLFTNASQRQCLPGRFSLSKVWHAGAGGQYRYKLSQFNSRAHCSFLRLRIAPPLQSLQKPHRTAKLYAWSHCPPCILGAALHRVCTSRLVTRLHCLCTSGYFRRNGNQPAPYSQGKNGPH